MKIPNLRYWPAMLLAVQATSGCGYIKSLFPDKERDYQFRTEIPELIVPEDLKSRSLSDKIPGQAAAPAPVRTAEQPAAAVSESLPIAERAVPQQMPASAKLKQPEIGTTAADASAVPAAGGNAAASSLQIDQPQAQAWRLVARALSRQKIEIVERNLDKAYFYVKYDPDAVKPEDTSFWDEMMFLFGEDPSHEQEYRISLLEIAPQTTEVTVQDNEGKTLSNRPASSLLKLITDGINLDLPTDTPEAVEKVPAP